MSASHLVAYNNAVRAGLIVHPSKKIERDQQILARYREVRSMKQVAHEFNLAKSSVSYAIQRAEQQEKQSCQDTL